jgi:hypothetical protein
VLLDDVGHCLHAIGVRTRREEAHGAASPRTRLPFVQDVRLSGVKPLLGLERMHALPRWLFRDEAIMPRVGGPAQQGRQGSCPRGATTRQGERLPGPICPATRAKHMVPWH